MYNVYFVATITIGLMMNNILLMISYLWEHIITCYFQRHRNIKFIIVMVTGVCLNLLVVAGIIMWVKQKNNPPLLWWANVVASSVCAGIAIVFSWMFIHRLERLGTV